MTISQVVANLIAAAEEIIDNPDLVTEEEFEAIYNVFLPMNYVMNGLTLRYESTVTELIDIETAATALDNAVAARQREMAGVVDLGEDLDPAKQLLSGNGRDSFPDDFSANPLTGESVVNRRLP